MKVRIIKKGERCYAELPSEFLNYDEIEMFQLKEGYCLVTPVLENSSHQKISEESTDLGEDDKLLLNKMLGVKFEKRTPASFDKVIDDKEKGVLERLLNKRVITIFKSTKYPNGVYNVSDKAYAMLKGPQSVSPKTAIGERKTENKNPDYSNYVALNTAGYMVIPDSRQAYYFSEAMKKLGKANDITGIKGFDGKFYVATKKYVMKVAQLLRQLKEDELNVQNAAQQCKIEPDGCRAVLKIMAEQGEALEKRKDDFVLI